MSQQNKNPNLDDRSVLYYNTVVPRYAPLYLSGVVNTLLLAVAATVLGCLIGLACGLLNTIPIHPQDRLPRFDF